MRTATGYAGGTEATPSYTRIGDHSETVRIVYDPAKISYEELLAVFWESHDPTAEPWNRQYRNAIFTLDARQKRAAEASRAQLARDLGGPIHTAIEKATPFTRAEERHQKYFLRQAGSLIEHFMTVYPDAADLTDSIAATRINGYLGCAGKLETLRNEIDSFGLSPDRKAQLLAYVAKYCANESGPTCGAPSR